MTHIQSPVIQTDDYYPFGLTFNSHTRENTNPQDYKYNSKELQDELGLGWLDYGARMYMPEIGRWGVIDPHAGKYPSMTPYNYGFDAPNVIVDPDGRDGILYIQVLLDKNGKSTIDRETIALLVKTLNQTFKELGSTYKLKLIIPIE